MMKAHIINLPHRTDRKEAMIEQCQRLGIKPIFFEATNGKEAFPDEPRDLMKGHFGCLDSHKRLLSSIYGTAAHHVIFEDDAVLSDLVPAFISVRPPSSYDLIFMGGNTFQMENAVSPWNELFNRAHNVLCTHAYIIQDSAIPKLLEVLNSRQWKVDILFTEFQKIANCYITKECLSWQSVSHSDITGKVLDGNILKY